ncbi:MAG: TSUP family transporter, partial [Nitrospiraceae bacterium]|nr:TSUP family transporter [Nitrospiraceae bacterium]
LSAANYYKNGYVNIKFAIVLILAFFIGSYLGSETAMAIPDKLLRKIFGGVVFLLSLKMIFGK